MLKVVPLAFESLGVRSMATYIETGDINIIIDPAVALAPSRFGLPPHPAEEVMKALLWTRVKEHVEKSNLIVVTHYHYDHVDPNERDMYSEKTVIIKHPKRMINPSQRGRAAEFLSGLRGTSAEVEYADGRSFHFGDSEVKFSKAVPHGMDAVRGYVVQVCVRSGETFLHTSDVQGPVLDEQTDFILEERPDLLFVDGPITYINSDYIPIELGRANENLVKIVAESGVKRVVIDHHLARDLDYLSKIEPVLKAGAEAGVDIMCAAEYLNEEPNLLEARRKELYEKKEGA